MATVTKNIVFKFETEDTAIEYELDTRTLWLYDLTDNKKIIGSVNFSSRDASEFVEWVESIRKQEMFEQGEKK